MTHGGGTVAGESPDRSEQRESSGETETGRDPRLAVLREGAPGSPADADAASSSTEPETEAERSSSPVATDQRTAVFRLPQREPSDADTDADADADASPSGDVGDADGDARDGGDGGRAGSDDAAAAGAPAAGSDARLRDAVAAWVATSDEDEDTPEAPKQNASAAAEAETADPDTDTGADPASGDAEPEPAAKADADDTEPEPAADEAPAASGDTEPEADDAPAAAKADAEPSTSAGAEPGADDGKPVDQPTAMFAMPKRPVVDQPTTALKLPKPATDPEKPAADAEKPAAGADADAEPARPASTFVPLHRDEPAPAPAGASRAETSAPAPANATRAEPAAPGEARAEADASAGAPPASLAEAERTRQQPMPPLPPLDLLAELTNTPPPPETPTRTLVRRVKIWTPLVLLLLIVFAVAQSFRPLPEPELALTADAEYAFDGERPSLPWPGEGQGQIVVSGLGTVGQFGEEKPVPIASVTKTMTAYIIMRDHPYKRGEDGASITIDALAEKEGGYDTTNSESTLNTVKEGQKISQRDALSAVMIPSANNIARLLARWDAGSEEAFVKKMNDTAKELGMTNTTYTDPSGLDATTVSTAADQVKLGMALVKNKAMVDITRQAQWTDPSGKVHPNYNHLPYKMGAIGIKTGSTTKAGGNLLFASYKDVGGSTQTIVGAVLGQHKVPILKTANDASQAVLTETRELLEAKKVVSKGDVVGYVDDGVGGRTPVVATRDMTVVGWSGMTVKSDITDGGKVIPHNAKAGTVVGSLTAGSGAGTISVPVALQTDKTEPGFSDKLTRIG
ncbi:D-alanyl-D-alanine carboxypeptidase [Streptomyces sp. NPDC005805]|uniref:D-alanyl-D-alanine carboxypeptidase n=1 Tax=Streptomyces sp. NPDC005805 TaxID=3157068 RepID=UPI0033CE7277